MNLAKRLRKLRKRNRKVPKARRKVHFEPLEPRFLLSADISTTGVAAVMDSGIDQLENDLNSFFDHEALLDTLVPLIVQQIKDVGPDGVDSDDIAPSISDLLDIPLDLDQDGDVDGDDITLGTSKLGVNITGLNAKDSNANTYLELMDDILKPMLFDQIATLLSGSPANDAAFVSALDGLDQSVTLGSLGFSFTVDGVSSTTNANEVSFELDLGITISQSLTFDLGTEADANAISVAGDFTLPVTASLDIENLTLGVYTSGETPTNSDFFIDANTMDLGVSVGGSLPAFDMSIGFLGVNVSGGTATLDADIEVDIIDPTDATGASALGFSASQTGTDSLTATSASDFDLDQQARFFLRLGDSDTREVSVASAGTKATLLSNINIGLSNAGFGYVTATAPGSNIILTLDHDPHELGFTTSDKSGSGTLTADIAPNFSDGNFDFLLSVDNAQPVKYSVSAGNIGALVSALDAALPAGITVTNNGGLVEFSYAGHTLQVVDTLAVNADKISYTDFQPPYDFTDILSAAKKAAAIASVNLPTSVIAGIGYSASTTINFSTADIFTLSAPTADEDGNIRFSIPFTPSGDFSEMLQFNRISFGTVIGQFRQLAAWFSNYADTDFFAEYDIPFGVAVNEILDFGDALSDALLIDDLDDGNDATWSSKLLKFDTESSSLQPNIAVGELPTAQKLASLLSTTLGLSGVNPTYNPTTDQLTYTLNLSNGFEKDYPVDFSLDLDPVLDIESSSEVRLSTTAGLTLTVGFDLGAPTFLTLGTNLTTLNRGAGVDIKTDAAVTEPNTPTLIYGQLSEDATFDVKVGGNTYEVNIYADDPDSMGLTPLTDDNTTVADLAADINTALATAKTVTSGVLGGTRTYGATVNLTSTYNLSASDVGRRIKLTSTSDQFDVDSLNSDTAYREIGFRDSETATQKYGSTNYTLTTGKDVPLIVGKLSNDINDTATADFTIEFDSDGTVYHVKLDLKDTVANRSVIDVINDVTNALKEAYVTDPGTTTDLTSRLAVSSQGLKLVITATDGSDFEINATNTAAQTGLGLGVTTLSSNSDDLLITLHDGTTQHRVDLDAAVGSDLNAIKTAIQTQTSGQVAVDINAAGSGLKLTDTTFSSPAPYNFQVEALNGSPAAIQLGILKGDITVPTETMDGIIEGGPLGGTTMAERFYINDGASVSGSISLTIPTSVTADARFGFIGIELDSSGGTATDSLSASVSGSLKDPGTVSDGKITLSELQQAFSSSGNITDVVNTPTYTGVSGDFDFGVTVTPTVVGMGNVGTVGIIISDLGNPLSKVIYPDTDVDFSSSKVFKITGDQTGTLKSGLTTLATLGSATKSSVIQGVSYDGGTNKTTVTLYNSILNDTLADVTVNTPVAPSITFDYSALTDLDLFEDLSLNNILDSLDTLIDFLQEFESSDLMSYQLPIINQSINDLVGYADDFLAAVQSIKNNPAATLQDIENKLNQAFGAGPSEDLIDLFLINDGLGDVLKFSLDLGTSFSGSVNVEIPNLLNIDLSALGLGTLPVDLSGSAGLTASGSLDLVLDFGISLNDTTPDLYVFDTTGLSATLSLAGADLSFRAALGPVGLFIDGGNISLSGNFDLGLDGAYEDFTDGRALLSEIFSSPIESGALDSLIGGSLTADLPVFFPTDTISAGSISLNVADLSAVDLSSPAAVLALFDYADVMSAIEDFDFSKLNIFDNMLLAVDGIEIFFDGLQYTLDSIFGELGIPIIGDAIKDAANFISDLQKDFVDPFRNLVENAEDLARDFADPTKNIVSEFLYDTLNPTGLLSASSIGSYDGFKGYFQNSKVGLSTNLDDYLFGPSETAPNIQDIFVQWNVSIGDEYSMGEGWDFDLGIPGLGLETEGEIDFTLGWDLDFGFGLSFADGFFIDIQDSNELAIWVKAELADGTTISGTLGFLKLTGTVSDTVIVDGTPGVGTDYIDINGNSTNDDPTAVGAAFAMNLANENDPTDKRLGFTELGDIDLNAEIAAQAQAGLGLYLTIDDALLGGANVASGFPSLVSDFVFDWSVPGTSMDFDNPENSTFEKFSDLEGEVGDVFKNGLNKVEFQNIGLDLGSYISDVLGPIVEEVQSVTKPIQPFIEVITTPIPVISDLGPDITLIDIAAAYGNVDPAMIYAIADIITVINSIPSPDAAGSVILDFGDMAVFDSSAGFEPELWDGNLDLSGAGGTFDQILGNAENLLSKATELLGDNWFSDAVGTLGGLAIDILDDVKFKEDGSAKGGGFSFPILDEPMQALGLLMGRDAVLVAYDMPPLEFEFEYSQFFSIWGPLGVSINGELAITIDFAFGYDTFGIRNFIESDFTDFAALFDGFYISDTDLPTGDYGTDVPELTFEGGLWAAAEINLVVARAGVGGGLFAEINFDLNDPDHDGKVRIKELWGNFENEWRYGSPALAPLAIFDVYGRLYAKLFAFLKIDLFLFEVDKEWNLTPEITILDFEIDFTRIPFLATELDNGDLILNMGKYAENRLYDYQDDVAETFYVKDGGAGEVQVWAPQFGVNEGDAQTYKVGSGGTIIIDGGQEDDFVDLSRVSQNFKYKIDGGVGDDKIYLNDEAYLDPDETKTDTNAPGDVAGGTATIYGGSGNDIIWGGSNDDIIYGQVGYDELHGSGGKDLIFGDDGELFDTSLKARVGPQDGDDELYGDAGMDILIGGGGVDIIYGGTEQDFILGDGGKIIFNSPKTADHIKAEGIEDTTRAFNGGDDELHGGAGNDVIFGGRGNDTLYGDADDDLMFGETGTDWLYGGTENDVIYGDKGDPTSYVIGNLDLVNPSSGILDLWYEMNPSSSGEVDYITGEAGNDRIFGSGGNDLIFGDSDNDTIFGGSGADVIGGGAGSDIIYGDAEPDTLYGGPGDDKLDGGAGNDILWGDEGPANLKETATSAIDWNEKVYGINTPADYEFGTTYSIAPLTGTSFDDTLISGNGTDFLDGQWGDDKYRIYMEGGDSSSNIINVYDSGNSAAQSDVMYVEGTMYDDTFLLRKSSSSSGLAFVALLNEAPNTERTNYWSVEGGIGLERMLVSGLFGSDHFAVDDVGTDTTIEGNEDPDTFQVGQLYNSPRDICASEYNNIEPEDVFATIETTVGWLSDGINKPMTIYGGTGDDYFTVFHNKAVLSLYGEYGDDTFLIKAFALAGSQEPIRERTDVSGGAGVDLVQYAMNAPVNIDGGDGFDRVIIIGTEFGDDLVVTKDGVYGAGLNVNFVNVESLTVDMAEGDDRVYVRSTAEDMITEIFGGLGSDTFNMSGDTPPVISNDLRGHSGIVTHDIENTGTTYDETIIAGISANVADDDTKDPVVVIIEPDGNTEIFEGGLVDYYHIVLSRDPGSNPVTVQVNAPIQTKDQFERKAKMFSLWSPFEVNDSNDRTSISLEFTSGNWSDPQTVYVFALDDSDETDDDYIDPISGIRDEGDYDDHAIEGDQTGFINHVVSTDLGIKGTPSHAPEVVDNVDPYEVTTKFFDSSKNFVDDYEDLAGYMLAITDGPGAGQSLRIKQVLENDTLLLWGQFRECAESMITPGETKYKITKDIEANRAIQVLVHDNDKADVITTETDDSTVLFEGGATDTVDVVLGREPDHDVTVQLTSTDSQLSFSDSSLVFTSANYDSPQTVTVTAADDDIREGFHHGLISLSSSSSDTDGIDTVTETIVLTEEQSYVGLMNRPKLVMTGDVGDYQVSSVTVGAGPALNDSTYKLVDGTLKVDVPGDYYVTYNKIVFLKPNGEYDKVLGNVVVNYTYDTVGYENLEIKPVLADIADNEVPQVLITETGGSTDVIEGTPSGTPSPDLWKDTYQVVLTKQPDADVQIRVTPEITKTSAGRIIHWGKQVAVTSSEAGAVQDGDDVILTFTTSNWDTPQVVKVTAIDDSVYDGDDTQVFAPEPHTISGIQGPLYLQGAGGNGSIVEFEPTMLHYETNFMPETGSVVVSEDGTIITVAKQPLFDGAAAINKEINMLLNYDADGNPLDGNPQVFSDEEIVAALVSEMMTVTIADGYLMDASGNPVDENGNLIPVDGNGVPINPDDELVYLKEIGQFRLITGATLNENGSGEEDDTVTLILNEAWDLSESWALSDDDVDSYDMITEYRITHMSKNFFADETEQIDYFFVYNEDSQADNQTEYRMGLLTDSTTIGYAGNSIVEEFVAELGGMWLSGFGMAAEDLTLAGVVHPRGITYGEMEVAEINLGDGIDQFTVEDTHIREDGFQTWTIINTGEGDDHITVNLDTNDVSLYDGTTTAAATSDAVTLTDTALSTYGTDTLAGFVVEITSGQGIGTKREIIANNGSQLTVSSSWNENIDSGTTYTIYNDVDGPVAINTEGGDDVLDGSTSTMPLVIFGGDNGPTGDSLTGGSADDIIFGDEGRVEYVDENGKIVTLLGLVRHKIDPQYINAWTATTLTDDDGNYPLQSIDMQGLEGLMVSITDGAGFRHDPRLITANTSDTLTISPEWEDDLIASTTGTSNASSAAGTNTLSADLSAFDTNELAGYVINILSGPASGAERLITGNTATGLTVDSNWDTEVPSGTEFNLYDPGTAPSDYDPTDPDTKASKARISLIPEDQTDGVVRDASLLIATNPMVGGPDTITGNAGEDRIFGGADDDTINGNADDDIIFGDHGRLDYTPAAVSREDGPGIGDVVPATLDCVRTTYDAIGGGDTVYGDDGYDIILGGFNNSASGPGAPAAIDTLYGNTEDDIILGDNGLLEFSPNETTTGDLRDVFLDRVNTLSHDIGGTDVISGNSGADVVMGGTAGDTIYGDDDTALAGATDGVDILIGDNGQIDLSGGVIGKLNAFGSGVNLIQTTDVLNSTGGADTMEGNAKGDVILGGVGGDSIYGDRSAPTATSISDDGDDYILGDNGMFEFELDQDDVSDLGRPDVLAHLGGTTLPLDPDPTTLDRIMITDPTLGDDDTIHGDAGNDTIFGGTGRDKIWGDSDMDNQVDNATDGDGADIIFGDHAKIYPHLPNVDSFFINNNFFSINTSEDDGFDTDGVVEYAPGTDFEDIIFGSGNADTIIGGQDDDILFGGADNDILIGGHNVVDGHDEMDDMDTASIEAILPDKLADLDSSDINDINDVMDGGSQNDVLLGDNAIVIRQNALIDPVDSTSPRYQLLTQSEIYAMVTENMGGLFDIDVGFSSNIQGDPQLKPGSDVGYTIILLNHSEGTQTLAAQNPADPRVFGNDVMAGGSEDDEMFGQLGDDIMQGDGSVDMVSETTGWQMPDSDTPFNPSPAVDPSFIIPDNQTTPTHFMVEGNYLLFHSDEAGTDGDDYMEGNAGNDRMYGNLGQDDMIGGNSTLFGLDEATAEFYGMPNDDFPRPDGADLMYGGAGDPDRLARNAEIDPATGDGAVPADQNHGRDADVILGDNGNIYRLVQVDEVTGETEYLTFNYDQITAGESLADGYSEDRPIIPRAVEFLDYAYSFTFDGTEVSATFAGVGYGDLIYGETGDDIIHGMTGDDALFGNGDDDDLYGEVGNDWVSGGTGDDGILGDDGLIKTSRNTEKANNNDTEPSEPLYGIAKLDEVDLEISTPGNLQRAIINVEDALKKTVDLISFNLEGDSIPVNDILYGGLGSDWIHAGQGDDAMSGGEALPFYYTNETIEGLTANELLQIQQEAPVNPGVEPAPNPFWFDFAPYNPGDILRYEGNTVMDPAEDKHGKTKQEFALYDEFFPRRKVMLDGNGEAVELAADAVYDFLLNFDEDEGPLGYHYLGDDVALPTDGNDRMFGDLGNDWMVGGTGRDHMYGGRGDDLLNMDDNHDSGPGGKYGPHDPDPDPLDNRASDEYQAYADIVYAGAGRDIMILNTGADRAIDWVGEYNSYIVPFAPFGAFHISRTLQPQVPEFLYALSESDGIDTTIPDGARYVEQKTADVRVDDPSAPENAFRNGEPYGELGMVRQTDYDWFDQTGAPNDPQPGNLQGKREIMRRELFTDSEPSKHAFAKEKGNWAITSGELEAIPVMLGEETVSIYHLDQVQPGYMEILATVNADKDIAGWKSNAYIFFDYQNADNFKFAGIDVGLDKLRIGHRTSDGWVIDVQANMQLKPNKDYDLIVALHGTVATLYVDLQESVSFDFGDPLNDGYLGLGTDNSVARFDDWQVQKLPPTFTFALPEDFPGTSPNPFEDQMGVWMMVDDRYVGASEGADRAVTTWNLEVALWTLLEFEAIVETNATGGLIFDCYGSEDFKFAAIDAAGDQVVIGHHTAKGWAIDAETDQIIESGASYKLGISLLGTSVSVTLDGEAVVGHVFNSLLNDGELGLLSRDGVSAFDDIVARGDDPAYATEDAGEALTASTKTLAIMNLPAGWSMISLPMIPDNPAVSALFPDAVVVYGYEKGKGYVREDTMEIGKGYWILFYEAQSYALMGQPIQEYASSVDSDGWNMIGGGAYSAQTLVDNGKKIDAIYEYVPGMGYQRVRELENMKAGKGYWILQTPVEAEIESENTLTDDALSPIVDEAIARWTEALGNDSTMVAALPEVTFQIVDLEDMTLGRAIENAVMIDIDAAGYGWFVDETPYDDVEFGIELGNGEMMATADSQAYRQMDLLTAVMHEVGHVLGLEDLDPETHDVMSATLDTGVRRLPGDGDIAALSQEGDGVENGPANLVVMDVSQEPDDTGGSLATTVAPTQQSSWLREFLLNSGQTDDVDPNAEIRVVIPRDENV